MMWFLVYFASIAVMILAAYKLAGQAYGNGYIAGRSDEAEALAVLHAGRPNAHLALVRAQLHEHLGAREGEAMWQALAAALAEERSNDDADE